MSGDARFYDAGRRRLWLSRDWGDPLNCVLLIGLNPSFADADRADHTITVEMEFAKRWGFSALLKGNLFDWVATNPDELLTAPNPHGDPQNLEWLMATAAKTRKIVCCWGDGGELHRRASVVRGALWDHRRKMFCLGFTKKGHPRHTSRLSYETALVPMWRGE